MAAKAVRTKPDPMVALIACGMRDTVASINHAAAVTAATVDALHAIKQVVHVPADLHRVSRRGTAALAHGRKLQRRRQKQNFLKLLLVSAGSQEFDFLAAALKRHRRRTAAAHAKANTHARTLC